MASTDAPAKEIEELTAAIGEDALLDRCGNALTSQAVGPKILWLKRNRPEIFAKTRTIHTSTSYLVERLTGAVVIDHYTASSSAPLYDVDRLDWSDELAPDIIELERLPKLAWTTDIAGTVTKRAAEETGLAEGTPVIVGTIDAAAEALSVGVLDPGDMMLMYGSTIFIIMLTASRVRDPRLWYAPWIFEGQHASMSGLATSGTLTHWFRDNFAPELDRRRRDDRARGGGGSFAARRARPDPPPLFLRRAHADPRPARQGRALRPEPHAHARRHLSRASRRHRLRDQPYLRDLSRRRRARRCACWRSAAARRTRSGRRRHPTSAALPQSICGRTIGASYGDAFLAALGVGDVKREDIRAWNPVASEITPHRVGRLPIASTASTEASTSRTKDLMREVEA